MIRKYIFVVAALVALVGYSQEHRWWHVYYQDYDFTSLKAQEVSGMQFQGEPDNSLTITLDDGSLMTVGLGRLAKTVYGTNVPTLYITLPDNPELNDLVEKETYLNAQLSIDGEGLFDDAQDLTCTIKGRGNSTWNYPKKPYRLKFSKKTSILGFEKQKNYVLIANYIDCTLMRNAIAFRAAQLLGMPYTNHVEPVRVYLNGNFKGAYFVSEKIGISGASVDIADEEGILWELDTYYDEDYKFRSDYYDLPVMVKDPDLEEVAETLGCTADELFEKWKADFTDFERKVYRGQVVDGVDYDLQSLVDYAIVYNFCGNRELSWPKSTYMYKADSESPYFFGPVWDFDWAFTYDNGYETQAPDRMFLSRWSQLKGVPFFLKLFTRSEFMELYAERWQLFVDEIWPQLQDYIDEYAAMIEPSAIENGVRWPAVTGTTESSFDFVSNVATLKQWLQDRVDFISTAENYGLY